MSYIKALLFHFITVFCRNLLVTTGSAPNAQLLLPPAFLSTAFYSGHLLDLFWKAVKDVQEVGTLPCTNAQIAVSSGRHATH